MTAYEISEKRPIKVRLNTDLTKYHPALKKGAEGTTNFRSAQWGVWCNFPIAGRWDIIPAGLDILDEEYLAAVKVDQQEERKKLKSDPRFFTSYKKLHLLVDIIHNDNDWDTNVMACGHTAKTGGINSHIHSMDETWCTICHAYYDKQLQAGLLPNRYPKEVT